MSLELVFHKWVVVARSLNDPNTVDKLHYVIVSTLNGAIELHSLSWPSGGDYEKMTLDPLDLFT